jgi:predicted nuclease of predicted toxin-antitoxin system
MRILLDGNLPRRLIRDLAGHTATTVQQMGWEQLEDPDLLDAIEGHFDVLLTVAKNMRFQNKISNKSFMVVVFEAARTNRYEDLQPYLSQLASALTGTRSTRPDVRGITPDPRTSVDYKLE